MTEFFVHNSLNITKAVKFNITLRYFVLKAERGDHKWILEIGTTHLDANGDPIQAKKIHNISAENLDEIIEEALSDMCSQIDWSPYVADMEAPYVVDQYPEDGSTVPISTSIYMKIKDRLPSAGIDLSGIKVSLNNGTVDFDITSEIEINGDPYFYELRWTPPMRVYDTYD